MAKKPIKSNGNKSNKEEKTKKKMGPMHDLCFKLCYGTEGHEHLHEGLVNGIMENATLKPIKNLQLKDKELKRETTDGKTVILDVRSEAEDGTAILIEAEKDDKKNIRNKVVFNWCKFFNELIQKGNKLKEIPKIICIAILNFDFDNKTDDYHNIYKFSNCKIENQAYQDLTNICEIHVIELPKFRKLKNKNYKNNKLHRILGYLDEKTPRNIRKRLIIM
ncbi:MAG: Rpn family recombination-promoting nuclease/putative transposase, partial [Methanobrevibacter sp.]|nr:Rpn family recombination-promoting nuclease/putative transposase [Methanobrevibacter sp.]